MSARWPVVLRWVFPLPQLSGVWRNVLKPVYDGATLYLSMNVTRSDHNGIGNTTFIIRGSDHPIRQHEYFQRRPGNVRVPISFDDYSQVLAGLNLQSPAQVSTLVKFSGLCSSKLNEYSTSH